MITRRIAFTWLRRSLIRSGARIHRQAFALQVVNVARWVAVHQRRPRLSRDYPGWNAYRELVIFYQILSNKHTQLDDHMRTADSKRLFENDNFCGSSKASFRVALAGEHTGHTRISTSSVLDSSLKHYRVKTKRNLKKMENTKRSSTHSVRLSQDAVHTFTRATGRSR